MPSKINCQRVGGTRTGEFAIYPMGPTDGFIFSSFFIKLPNTEQLVHACLWGTEEAPDQKQVGFTGHRGGVQLFGFGAQW